MGTGMKTFWVLLFFNLRLEAKRSCHFRDNFRCLGSLCGQITVLLNLNFQLEWTPIPIELSKHIFNISLSYLHTLMAHLSQLKQFISRSQIITDPYWRSILTSDNRNIFPKHQLAKIELAKNKLAKQRLMMDELPHFLALQVYARKMKSLSQTAQEKDMKGEVEHLTQQFQKCKKEIHSSDYQFEVIEKKEKIQYFCSQMGRPKIKPELKQLVEANPKWKNYLEINNKKAQPMEAAVKEKDRCQLARVIELGRVDDALKMGTAGKIVEERVKQEVLMHRLKEIFQKGLDPKTVEVPDDPWKQDWQSLLEHLNESDCYV